MRRTTMGAGALVLVLAGACADIVGIHSLDVGAGGSGGMTATSSRSSTGGGPATTSSATTSSSSGMPGACDAGTACKSPADCAAPGMACLAATCSMGCCGSTNAAVGTICMQGTNGKVCDGSGACVACTMPTDCGAQSTKCTINTCTAGACGTSNAASGTGCTDNGGSVCDSAGKCLACNMASDCPPQPTVCKTNTCSLAGTCGTMNAVKGTACTDGGGTACDGNGTCVTTSCADGVKDGNETDIDCGGSCAPCADGEKCLIGTDCVDRVCNATKTCSNPSCSDGVQNGMETDIDCGGAQCDGQGKTCVDQKHCATNADCKNNQCFGAGPGTCVSCMDGVKDGNETDIDCGGAQCDALGKTCAAGKGCGLSQDCTSGVCQAASCELRPDGDVCSMGSMCVSGVCVGGICCQTACSDQGAASCGTTAVCRNDGSACLDYAAGTVCVGASCSGSTLFGARTCDGSGTCEPGASGPCPGSLVCANASSCKTSCFADGDCTAPLVCQNPGPSGTCMPGSATSSASASSSASSSGSACSTGAECTKNCCCYPSSPPGVCALNPLACAQAVPGGTCH